MEVRSLKQLLTDWQTACTECAEVAVYNIPHAQPPKYDGMDVTLTKFTEKTSEVSAGSCFVARVRTQSDGHVYVGKAIELGASMILAQRSAQELGVTVPKNVVYLQVADTAVALAWFSAAWHGFPSRELIMIGITGTNGKTTIATILHTMLQTAGVKVGLLSTLKAVIGGKDEALELHVTTPEAPVVQAHLRRMVSAGMTHCVLETTSHSLAQHRVTAVEFDIAIMANITHEHLDYHQTWDAYVAAKTRLFELVALQDPPTHKPFSVPKTLILNRDDPHSYTHLSKIDAPNIMSYSIDHEDADLVADDIQLNPWSTQFSINPAQIKIKSKLFGLFNVYNMLAAATAVTALNIPPNQIKAGLEAVEIVNGRMQPINRGQEFLVMVDFAHTPDGLEKAIDAARHTITGAGDAFSKRGRVITIFGSAGKRDPEKRRMMAEISARDADLTILTAEDPRTESLDDILDAMAQGCHNQGGKENKTFWRIDDRGQAIYFALTLAQKEDIVLICGKGHEQSMCFITTEYPWDDITATETAVDAFLNHQPMPDLGLPTFDSHQPPGGSIR